MQCTADSNYREGRKRNYVLYQYNRKMPQHFNLQLFNTAAVVIGDVA